MTNEVETLVEEMLEKELASAERLALADVDHFPKWVFRSNVTSDSGHRDRHAGLHHRHGVAHVFQLFRLG